MHKRPTDRYPQFRLMLKDEGCLVALQEELRQVLDELSPRVHAMWNSNREDARLCEASASLTIAAASLQSPLLRLGPVVLMPMRPYWLRRNLVSSETVQALAELEDNRINRLLEQAVRLDRQIRTSCPKRYSVTV